jgi:HEAT repeat protein
MRAIRPAPAVAFLIFLAPSAAIAYIDAAPTLGRLMTEASHICVLKVEKVNVDKRVVVFRKISNLKGGFSEETLNHVVSEGSATFLLDWAIPARTAIAFVTENASVTCLGTRWYECHRTEGAWWTVMHARPELSLAYLGSTEKLKDCVSAILSGKEVVITTAVHGADGLGAYFDVAMKETLSGRSNRVQRIKAGLEMPLDCWHIGKDPRWFVGFGPAGPADVPTLIQALKRPEAEARSEAAADLAQMGKDAEGALSALRDVARSDPDDVARIRAAEALLRIDPTNSGTIQSLVERVSADDVSVRRAAIESLGNIGPEARTAVPALIRQLQDPDVGVRGAAADSLSQIGPAADAAVSALVNLLKDPRLGDRAAEALGGIGPRAAPAVPALAERVNAQKTPIRWSFIGALVSIGGPGAKAVMPPLLRALQSGETRAYYNATLCLSALGPGAKEALPELMKKSDDLSACAIWSIDPKNGIQGYVLTSLTTDRTCDQWFAASHFQKMGAWRKDVARAVAEALLDGKLPDLAPWAVDRILRGEAGAVLPVLRGALKSQAPETRRLGVVWLGRMGSDAKPALAELTKAQKDSDAGIREAASESIKQVTTIKR